MLIRITDLAVRPFLVGRTTRNRVGELERALLAEWYVARVVDGDRNPARTLADRYPESSYKTWANIFSRMRTQEPALLTGAPRRGVAGGWLTDHAEAILGYGEAAVPAALREEYEATRDIYPAPVRRHRRTAPPARSKFATDAEYDDAYAAWARRGVWAYEVEIGPNTFEDFDDWWIRMREEESEGW